MIDPRIMESGGLIWFAGGRNPFKAGLEAALLSLDIEIITHSAYSHVGIVPPEQYWSDAADPALIESTIWGSVSGPQLNDLGTRLHLDYQAHGGRAWFRPFLPEFAPDWTALWAAARQMFAAVKAGKLHYSVKRLFGDAVARNWLFEMLPVAGILEHLSEHDRGVVCSECAGLLLQSGGVDAKAKAAGLLWLPKAEPVAGQPIGCAPEDLWEMKLWGPFVTVL